MQVKYNIANLEWQQFELLAFKCLQKDVAPSLQYLEGGNDKGRDFVFEGVTDFFGHSGANERIIFQAKHKSKFTDFASLKQDLSIELTKVYVRYSLYSTRYCLVTNLPLSANQIDELELLFKDFVSLNLLTHPANFSIYSYRHFEVCLDKHRQLRISFPSIMQIADMKAILEEIFDRPERNTVSSWLKVFEKNITKFIYTTVYESALRELHKSDAILLSGPPKSGKTFTAEMLAFNLFLSDEYTPYVIASIDAFTDLYDSGKKQLFLFDDSFGRHNIEGYRADALDRRAAAILNSLDANHKMIFTSREYILKDYQSYTDSVIFLKAVVKVNASATDWTQGEKESLLQRYFKLAFGEDLAHNLVRHIVQHKNYEPETIRAFFETSGQKFKLENILKHLEQPDRYLEKLFININEDKKLVLLSILLSLRGTEKDIGFTFNHILSDLGIQRLINLNLQLEVLQDSLIVLKDGVYTFLHPSMFDFFIQLVSTDSATYRKLLFSNITPTLLSSISLMTKTGTKIQIVLELADMPNMATGFERIFKNPAITLFEINSVLSWCAKPDVQLRMKSEFTHAFSRLKVSLFQSIQKLEFNNILKYSNIFQAIDFIKGVTVEGGKGALSDSAIESLLKQFNGDPNYWQLALRASSFLSEKQVLRLIGRNWFREFSTSIQIAIDSLGKKLFGDAYPDFDEMKRYQKEALGNPETSLESIQKKFTSFYLQRTDELWYPAYKEIKQKIAVLKSSHPYGYKIYAEVIERFELIKRLEDYERNRYVYKLKNRNWDMIKGRQPMFIDMDEWAEREESEYIHDMGWEKDEEE